MPAFSSHLVNSPMLMTPFLNVLSLFRLSGRGPGQLSYSYSGGRSSASGGKGTHSNNQIAQALAIVTDANEDQLNAAEEILLNQYEDPGKPCIVTCVTTEKVRAGPEAGESIVQDPGMEMPVISDLQPEEHNGAALETGFAYKLTPVTAKLQQFLMPP